MASPIAAPTCYPVETSGWDLDENFFVEKTELEWSDEEKHVSLRHPVRMGAVVFVRLLSYSTHVSVCPVAYEVVRIHHNTQLRQYEVSLSQLHPRAHEPALNDAGIN
jgi:hypothetical protein